MTVQIWRDASFKRDMSVGEIITAADDLRKRLRGDIALANREVQELHEAVRRSGEPEAKSEDVALLAKRARDRADVALKMAEVRLNSDEFRSRIAHIHLLVAISMVKHSEAREGPKNNCRAACRAAYASAATLETACGATLTSGRALEERGVDLSPKEIQGIRESSEYAKKCKAEVAADVGLWWRYRFSRSM